MPQTTKAPARSKKAGNTQFEDILGSRTEDNLGEAAKIFRDAFVREYIKDFRGDMALFRLGHVNLKTAQVKASQLIREPYVARRLDEMVRKLRPEDVVTRQEVMALMWKEANDQRNGDKARVAACANVGKMLGMMNAKEENTGAPTGVMFIPCTSPEDWAIAAEVAQARLKANAAQHA